MRLVLLVAALAVFLISGTAPAGPKQVELPPFTPEREAVALQFVTQNHVELNDVLARLKKLNPEQYQQAIRQLFQETETLAAAKANDEKGHELMLESWKVKSRIEVLGARLACATEKDPALEVELKQLLYRQVDLHRLTIEHNRERTLAAVKVMEANIKLLEENRDKLVERRLNALTSSGKKAPANPPKKATPPQ